MRASVILETRSEAKSNRFLCTTASGALLCTTKRSQKITSLRGGPGKCYLNVGMSSEENSRTLVSQASTVNWLKPVNATWPPMMLQNHKWNRSRILPTVTCTGHCASNDLYSNGALLIPSHTKVVRVLRLVFLVSQPVFNFIALSINICSMV